jgi:hypothetical protein
MYLATKNKITTLVSLQIHHSSLAETRDLTHTMGKIPSNQICRHKRKK